MSSFCTTLSTASFFSAASLVSFGPSFGAPKVTTLVTSTPAAVYSSPTATATAPPSEWPVICTEYPGWTCGASASRHSRAMTRYPRCMGRWSVHPKRARSSGDASHDTFSHAPSGSSSSNDPEPEPSPEPAAVGSAAAPRRPEKAPESDRPTLARRPEAVTGSLLRRMFWTTLVRFVVPRKLTVCVLRAWSVAMNARCLTLSRSRTVTVSFVSAKNASISSVGLEFRLAMFANRRSSSNVPTTGSGGCVAARVEERSLRTSSRTFSATDSNPRATFARIASASTAGGEGSAHEARVRLEDSSESRREGDAPIASPGGGAPTPPPGAAGFRSAPIDAARSSGGDATAELASSETDPARPAAAFSFLFFSSSTFFFSFPAAPPAASSSATGLSVTAGRFPRIARGVVLRRAALAPPPGAVRLRRSALRASTLDARARRRGSSDRPRGRPPSATADRARGTTRGTTVARRSRPCDETKTRREGRCGGGVSEARGGSRCWGARARSRNEPRGPRARKNILEHATEWNIARGRSRRARDRGARTGAGAGASRATHRGERRCHGRDSGATRRVTVEASGSERPGGAAEPARRTKPGRRAAERSVARRSRAGPGARARSNAPAPRAAPRPRATSVASSRRSRALVSRRESPLRARSCADLGRRHRGRLEEPRWPFSRPRAAEEGIDGGEAPGPPSLGRASRGREPSNGDRAAIRRRFGVVSRSPAPPREEGESDGRFLGYSSERIRPVVDWSVPSENTPVDRESSAAGVRDSFEGGRRKKE